MDFEELERRVTQLDAKVVEIEEALMKIVENMQKNLEIIATIHETFQNLNAYLMVNVGPPLFVD